MSKTSPTQRSLALLRKTGYTVAVVERWNPHAMIRQDLFGFADLLAIAPQMIAVQTTSGPNVSARIAKIRDNPNAALWLAAGHRIIVHGWSKRGPRGGRKTWHCREEEITEDSNAQTIPDHG